MKRQSIEAIQEVFQYDPTAGTLRWKTRPNNCVRPGYIAGRKHANGHIEVSYKGASYMAHHLAWCLHYGTWPVGKIQHLNGDKADNRAVNLALIERGLVGQPVKQEGEAG